MFELATVGTHEWRRTCDQITNDNNSGTMVEVRLLIMTFYCVINPLLNVCSLLVYDK